jgi:hypothetical protein
MSATRRFQSRFPGPGHKGMPWQEWGREPEPPIPDPVADFTIAPAAPTSADPIILTSTGTPAEHIVAYEWGQQMPVDIAPGEGPAVMNLGPQAPGAYVWNHRVRLTDGRWSPPRSRGVNITAAPPDPEEPDPEEPDTEPPPEEE